MPTVAIIGAGYVGLTTAACLAHLGNSVHCADISTDRVAMLSRGEVPIVEQGLGELLRGGLSSGRLRFDVDNGRAVVGAGFVFLCVPTPQGADGHADTSFIEAAAATIAPELAPGCIVVNKSTVPVGSTKVIERVLDRTDVAVVSNPEFLREGTAVQDFLHPDRVVIGAEDRQAGLKLASLYVDLRAPLVLTDPASAETIKYASNAFLATKISFANAVAALCESVGADVVDVMAGIGLDKRVGPDFLRPGPGWGGSCLPKDTAALVKIAADAGYDFSLLRGVIAVNEEQHRRVADKAANLVGGSLAGKAVGLLGLSFKAGTDDLRQSPALAVAQDLTERGALVRAYDPTVDPVVPPPVCRGIEVVGDPYLAAEGAYVLVVATEWDEFRWLDLARLADVMAFPAVVDARNVLGPRLLREAGFDYAGIGTK